MRTQINMGVTVSKGVIVVGKNVCHIHEYNFLQNKVFVSFLPHLGNSWQGIVLPLLCLFVCCNVCDPYSSPGNGYCYCCITF